MSNCALGNVNQSSAPSHNQATLPCGNMNTLTEDACIYVVVKSDMEPVIFRGDNTDKYIVN